MCEISGVGGDAMRAENFISLFPMSEISVMGVLPVLANLRNVLKRIDQTARAVIAARPDALVLIDSPDFTHRVARQVRKVLPGLKMVELCRSDGLGVAAGPREDGCAPMSIWSWRSFPSNRRPISGLAGRAAFTSAIP